MVLIQFGYELQAKIEQPVQLIVDLFIKKEHLHKISPFSQSYNNVSI